MSWRNFEGYSDPTAGEALGNITREERRRRRRLLREGRNTVDQTSGTGKHDSEAGRTGLPGRAKDAQETPGFQSGNGRGHGD